jgi:anti-anti-sigma factor
MIQKSNNPTRHFINAEKKIVQTTQDKIANALILRIQGRLDGSTAGSLEQHCLSLLALGERMLLFDLSQLGYISSAGLRVFLLITKQLKSSGGKLALFTLQENVKNVFEIAGFTRFLNILPTQEEAMNALTNAGL